MSKMTGTGGPGREPYRSLVGFLPEATRRETIEFVRTEAPRAWGRQATFDGAGAEGSDDTWRRLWYSARPGVWGARHGVWWCVAEGPDPLTCLPSLLQALEGEVHPTSLWCAGRLGASRVYLAGLAPTSAWMPTGDTSGPGEPVLQWESGARALSGAGPRGWVTAILALGGAGVWALALALLLITPIRGTPGGDVSAAQNAWRKAWLTAVPRLRAQPDLAIAEFRAQNGFWSARYTHALAKPHARAKPHALAGPHAGRLPRLTK